MKNPAALVRRGAARTLKLSEIFHSLQGESTRAGLPTVFIRLTGCPLRCVWCDTRTAFSGGTRIEIADILTRVGEYATRFVCVTGGEPLAQPECLTLLADLCDAGYDVSLETSGALDISRVDPRVSRVVDFKAPGSGESEKNHWPNVEALRANDEVKFVLASRADYEWARRILAEHRLDARCAVLFSAVGGALPNSSLADWILEDRLPVRLQLQLHKVLWPNSAGK
ncbi:MAG: 7-carboxy-7-deazaguanine synthase QueE [Candidatus Accumulibacter sp.]|jgi:7-carboxy-7-deazaguanine synthase|nr:7-carboxy-7-deazaguanine synthase QueE [Accumulibacter sp.]